MGKNATTVNLKQTREKNTPKVWITETASFPMKYPSINKKNVVGVFYGLFYVYYHQIKYKNNHEKRKLYILVNWVRGQVIICICDCIFLCGFTFQTVYFKNLLPHSNALSFFLSVFLFFRVLFLLHFGWSVCKVICCGILVCLSFLLKWPSKMQRLSMLYA